jgi:hypothetical protein
MGDTTWWNQKLDAYRHFLRAPVVDVANPAALDEFEHTALSKQLDVANMALYRVTGNSTVNHAAVLALGRQFGLRRPHRNLCADQDGVSDIMVHEGGPARRYIPYTSRSLGWHTDGYYYPDDTYIRSFILHCVSQADEGGANQFLDHEILLALLGQDASLDLGTLFAPDVFSIPSNTLEGTELRARFEGPVFAFVEGRLVMRFSDRQHNLSWKQDQNVLTAVEAIRHYLNHSDLVLSIRLQPGMGIISRNVPHRRDAFVDSIGAPRRFLRARYHDAIATSMIVRRDDLAQ